MSSSESSKFGMSVDGINVSGLGPLCKPLLVKELPNKRLLLLLVVV